MKQFIALVSAVVVLAACTTPPPVAAPKVDAESAALLSAAISRSEKLPSSTASADAKAPAAAMSGASISINFAGEAKDLLRQVAATRGKTLQVRGAVPHMPLFVIVDVKNVSFEDFLADVGAQFGQRADLVLTNNSLEVRYRDHQ